MVQRRIGHHSDMKFRLTNKPDRTLKTTPAFCVWCMGCECIMHSMQKRELFDYYGCPECNSTIKIPQRGIVVDRSEIDTLSYSLRIGRATQIVNSTNSFYIRSSAVSIDAKVSKEVYSTYKEGDELVLW